MATLDPMDGLIVAGEMFLISCTINGANNLEANFLFTLTPHRNKSIVKTANTKQLQHGFIAKASDAGKYICNATVTSAFLDGPIIKDATVTVIVQSKQILVFIAMCAYKNV